MSTWPKRGPGQHQLTSRLRAAGGGRCKTACVMPIAQTFRIFGALGKNCLNCARAPQCPPYEAGSHELCAFTRQRNSETNERTTGGPTDPFDCREMICLSLADADRYGCPLRRASCAALPRKFLISPLTYKRASGITCWASGPYFHV